jgi:hypothetical protein
VTDVRFLLIAGALFALASVSVPIEAAGLALAGVVVGLGSFGTARRGSPSSITLLAGLLAVAVSILALRTGLVRIPAITRSTLAAWLGGLASLGIVIGFVRRRREVPPAITAVSSAFVVLLSLGMAVAVVNEHANSNAGTDV